jgi:predicted nucleic acid-binding Zn ribbon protein
MGSPTSRPPERHSGVRTADPLLCPVCRKITLQGKQTVCSGKCRARRHRGHKAKAAQVAGLRQAAALLMAEAERLEATP